MKTKTNLPANISAALIILSIIFSCQRPGMKQGKEVIFESSFACNYILHIYAVAGIGFNSSYQQQYSYSVNSSDIAALKEHQSLLAFSNGRSGGFAFLCFFLPSYLELNNENEFREYYSLLTGGLRSNDYSKLFERFPVDTDDPFIGPNMQFFNLPDSVWDKEIRPYIGQFLTVAGVFMDNIDIYEEEIWPEVKDTLGRRAKHLNKLFTGKKITASWEKLIGLKFNERYRIFLCYSSDKGPDANSLSYDKNVFFYNSPDNRMVDFISHEVGTHLLFPYFDSLASVQKVAARNFSGYYSAVESLAMFYNTRVLGKKELAYRLPQFRDTYHDSLYTSIYHHGISHEEMLMKALSEEQR